MFLTIHVIIYMCNRETFRCLIINSIYIDFVVYFPCSILFEHFFLIFITIPSSSQTFFLRFYYSEKDNSLPRNGIDCMANVPAMKSTILYLGIVDFLVNMREKVLHTLVFIRIGSECLFIKYL